MRRPATIWSEAIRLAGDIWPLDVVAANYRSAFKVCTGVKVGPAAFEVLEFWAGSEVSNPVSRSEVPRGLVSKDAGWMQPRNV
jgi:hypothetical protein